MKEEKHLFDELEEKIHRIQRECPVARDFTLKGHVSELESEVSEVKEALGKEDWEHVQEELGDVLWDWLTMCKLAEQEKRFTTRQVLEELREKLHRRNPHVFGDVKVKDKEVTRRMWKKIKQREKRKKGK